MLTFVGLGLYDDRSVTLRGRDAIRGADAVFAEFYTSQLTGTTVDELEAAHGVDIDVRDRAGVEEDPGPILDAAAEGRTVFLTGGDPMISTTHVDLRLRAADRGIETRVVHGTTAQTAASSLTGLQNYRFGPATTLPFPDSHGADSVPESVLETVRSNRDHDLHTLVYLDVKPAEDRYLRGDRGAGMLAEHFPEQVGVVVARAGSDEPSVTADALSTLAGMDFGPPLHLLVVPGRLHDMEAEALRAFADAPGDVLDSST